jgi:hypothetical protein
MDALRLSRDELLERLELIDCFPELKSDLGLFLERYVYNKDLEVVERLLAAGADPNATEDLHDYMLWLLHEYLATKSTSGERILALMEVLLQGGANPNRIAMNNLRAYDYARQYKLEPLVSILEKYGVDKSLREFM